jgi:tripartite-type tricarboxylate transporter receptor subunit TctC
MSTITPPHRRLAQFLARWGIVAVLAMSVAAIASRAQAQDYPARPVRIMVGFGPGSSADITARALSLRLSQILGQQFVVEIKPGAASGVAAEFVARAPKDGYTLFLASSANLTNQAINPNVSFDMVKDFAPIALATSVPIMLVVHPSIGVNSVQDLVALAKAKPGEVLYASTGVGTAPHLSGELFAQRAGVKLVHVPYQGSPQAATDLLAGRVTMMFSPISAVIAQVEAGKLKALASATSKRPAIAPSVPTMAEAGMPDFDTSIWFGLVAPAGTPREIVDKLARAVGEAQKSDDVLKVLRAQGFDAISGGPDDFGKSMQREIKRWTDVAQAAGLKK